MYILLSTGTKIEPTDEILFTLAGEWESITWYRGEIVTEEHYPMRREITALKELKELI